MNDIEKANIIVSQCERRGINLCCDFESWTNIAFALSTLGEEGRPLFHRLACMDEAYKENENDKKFTNAMRTNKDINFATFIYHAKCNGVDVSSLKDDDTYSIERHRVKPQRRIQPVDDIPINLIRRSTSAKNGLCDYLSAFVAQDSLSKAVSRYYVAGTRAGETIFPQIDAKGRCRTGKVIAYDSITGHRIKERGADWLHTRYCRKIRKEPSGYNLKQCLFGEHLLPQYPETSVCIVEAEKTAFVCSMVWPDSVWVATGGMQGFTEERLLPLATRRVVVFPDADATECWRGKAQCIPFARTWAFSNWAKDEAAGSKRDIADLMLGYIKQHPEVLHKHVPTPEEILAGMKRKNPAFGLLCEKLDLEIVAV